MMLPYTTVQPLQLKQWGNAIQLTQWSQTRRDIGVLFAVLAYHGFGDEAYGGVCLLCTSFYLYGHLVFGRVRGGMRKDGV